VPLPSWYAKKVYLRLDSKLIRAAWDANSDSVAIVQQGRVLYANPAFARTFGYLGGAEMKGRTLADFALDGVFSDGAGPHAPSDVPFSARQSRECICRRKDGSRIHLQLSWADFRFGSLDFSVLSTAAQRQPQPAPNTENLESIGRLLGGVAHDFNNLLTGIVLYCDLLVPALEDSPASRRKVQEIRRAAENGSSLIRQLLALARRRPVEASCLSLNEVANGAIDLLSHLVGENIELVTVLAEDLGLVEMDRSQLEQIILNLVLNARDAMPEGGRITLATNNCFSALPRSNGHNSSIPISCVELVVSDTGWGMIWKQRLICLSRFLPPKSREKATASGLPQLSTSSRDLGERLRLIVSPEKGRGSRFAPRALIRYCHRICYER
jgi:signal transduction histidine kinase